MNPVATIYDQVVERFEADLARKYPGITRTFARYAEMARLGHIEQGGQRRPIGMLITATDEAGSARQIGRDYPEAA
jgi:hypothetical protein